MASGRHAADMVPQMMHMGWLGPRDMHGPGGHSPVDDVIGGPGHPGGGHMGGHGGDTGGSGDDSGHDHGGGSMGGSGG